MEKATCSPCIPREAPARLPPSPLWQGTCSCRAAGDIACPSLAGRSALCSPPAPRAGIPTVKLLLCSPEGRGPAHWEINGWVLLGFMPFSYILVRGAVHSQVSSRPVGPLWNRKCLEVEVRTQFLLPPTSLSLAFPCLQCFLLLPDRAPGCSSIDNDAIP